jgi:hypothetical protein
MLVSLESSKLRILNIIPKLFYCIMFANETAMQNIWQYHFLEPLGGGGGLWNTCAHRACENSKTLGIQCKGRFFTTSCDPTVGYTLRLSLTHFA